VSKDELLRLYHEASRGAVQLLVHQRHRQDSEGHVLAPLQATN
jgi:hypothetical protein